MNIAPQHIAIASAQGPVANRRNPNTPDGATSINDVYNAINEEASQPLLFVDGYHPQATVGVLDIFQGPTEDHALHGDAVEAIVAQNAGLPSDSPSVLKIEHGMVGNTAGVLSNLLYQDGPEPFSERVDAYIQLSVGHSLAKTNGTLEKILENPGELRTLNQSQGSSRVDAYQLLIGAALKGAPQGSPLGATGEKLAEIAGMDPKAADFPVHELRQRLIDRVASVVEKSEYIAELQHEHIGLVEGLKSKGIAMVTSAGNNADELNDYWSRGLKVDENFDDDITSIGPKIVVGAVDTRGTSDTSDDQVAYFSSQYGAVNVLANGCDVPSPYGPKTGTSFASPQVAGTLERVRRENPEWTLDHAIDQTRSLFTQTNGFTILHA